MPVLKPHGILSLDTFEDGLSLGPTQCDLSELRLIDVYGLVGAAVLLAGTADAPFEAQYVPPVNVKTAGHLTHLGFGSCLSQLGVSIDADDGPIVDAPDVVVPLRIVEDTKALEALSHFVYARLDRNASPQVVVALSEALWELGANALEHSGRPAIIAAQRYPIGIDGELGESIEIVIGDAGKGIRQSFDDSGLHHPSNDQEALSLAADYLVSSVDDPGRGQGLFTTIESAVGLGGIAVIRSGMASLREDGQGRRIGKVEFIHGTLVGVRIPVRPGG